MKKTLLTLALVTLAPATFAQTVAASKSHSNAVSAAQNAGNAQSITFNSEANDRLKTNPDVAGNGYYGSFSSDFCMGSAGGGFSGGFIGVNGVTPVRDEQCSVLRGVERTMQVATTVQATNPELAASLHQGAVDMLCMLNETVGAALKQQGVCSQQTTSVATNSVPQSTVAPQQTEVDYTGNDPIVLRRLGVLQ